MQGYGCKPVIRIYCCINYIQFLYVCYLPQNKVKDLVKMANGQACSLLLDGHNSSDLQLDIRGCAACKHWQRPSCIYKSICPQIYLADSSESARELYMDSLYVSALRPWEYADTSTSHKLGSESHSYFGWPHEFSG